MWFSASDAAADIVSRAPGTYWRTESAGRPFRIDLFLARFLGNFLVSFTVICLSLFFLGFSSSSLLSLTSSCRLSSSLSSSPVFSSFSFIFSWSLSSSSHLTLVLSSFPLVSPSSAIFPSSFPSFKSFLPHLSLTFPSSFHHFSSFLHISFIFPLIFPSSFPAFHLPLAVPPLSAISLRAPTAPRASLMSLPSRWCCSNQHPPPPPSLLRWQWPVGAGLPSALCKWGRINWDIRVGIRQVILSSLGCVLCAGCAPDWHAPRVASVLQLMAIASHVVFVLHPRLIDFGDPSRVFQRTASLPSGTGGATLPRLVWFCCALAGLPAVSSRRGFVGPVNCSRSKACHCRAELFVAAGDGTVTCDGRVTDV